MDEPDARAEGDAEREGALSVEAAFSLLANETRLGVLRALWEHYDPYTDDRDPMTFTELRRAVGYADAGNFSFHLEKLLGQFLAKTDDGYELTQAGLSLVQTVVAGHTVDAARLDRSPVDQPCGFCGATTTVAFDDGTATFACTECEGAWENGMIGALPVPPNALADRTPGEFADATVHWYLHRMEALLDGVCPVCAGTVEHAVERCPDHEADGGRCGTCERRYATVVRHVCTTCKHRNRAPFRATVLGHPAVVAFHEDHDVAYDYPSLDALLRSFDWPEAVVAEDPLRVVVTVPVDDEELRLTLDAAAVVVAVERSTPDA